MYRYIKCVCCHLLLCFVGFLKIIAGLPFRHILFPSMLLSYSYYPCCEFSMAIMFQRIHQIYRPHPALRGLINNFGIQKVELDTSKALPFFPMPPIQEQAIFFYPQDPVHLQVPNSDKIIKLPGSTIVARNLNRVNVIMGYHHLVLKIGFEPGGLYRLFGIPVKEFGQDEEFNETAIWADPKVPFIIEQLQEAASFDQMIDIVQKWLLLKLSKLKRELPLDIVLPYILNRGNLNSISALASQACVSIRQLERLFQQRLGLPPQYYARLVRFTKAWVMKEKNPDMNWTKLAHHCGYFDQMHLVRDFKEFGGGAPKLIERQIQSAPCILQHEVFL